MCKEVAALCYELLRWEDFPMLSNAHATLEACRPTWLEAADTRLGGAPDALHPEFFQEAASWRLLAP